MEKKTSNRGPLEVSGYAAVAALAGCVLSLLISPYFLKLPVGVPPPASAARALGKAEDVFCRVGVKAPMPFLRCDSPVKQFDKLRRAVVAGAGFDFLATCGDMMRNKNARSSKPGVADNSRHKSGQAFDYNQEDGRVAIVREYTEGRTYWRTYLRCERQDGACGVKLDLDTDNAGRVSAYFFDFTAAAAELGWGRIPAQEGWERSWTKKEFWHYEMKEEAEADDEAAAAVAGVKRNEKPSPFVAPLRYLADVVSLRRRQE